MDETGDFPPSFTPTQLRILRRLSDGLPHSKEEMIKTIDELATLGMFSQQLWILRKKLLPLGQDIVCRTHGGGRQHAYQHVRLLASANDGRK